MADKRQDPGRSLTNESVSDYARREMAEIADRKERRELYWEGQKRVAIELPERFMRVADQVRAEVDSFNQIVDASRRLSLEESAGLAARADHAHAELNLSVRRGKAELWIGLAELMRLGHHPPAFIIEAQVRLSQARIRIRAEGIPTREGIRYRVTIDGREASIGLEELGSKLVLTVAKDDPSVLGIPADPV
jgi:hypothetical protein